MNSLISRECTGGTPRRIVFQFGIYDHLGVWHLLWWQSGPLLVSNTKSNPTPNPMPDRIAIRSYYPIKPALKRADLELRPKSRAMIVSQTGRCKLCIASCTQVNFQGAAHCSLLKRLTTEHLQLNRRPVSRSKTLVMCRITDYFAIMFPIDPRQCFYPPHRPLPHPLPFEQRSRYTHEDVVIPGLAPYITGP